MRPEVRLIDYTGGNAFGDWLEENARQAVVFTEKAGVNAVVARLDVVVRGDVPEPRVLVRALHRPDVHGAAERLPARRRHRDRRGPQVGRRGGRRARPRRSTSCSATTPARSSCSAGWSTRGVLERLEAAASQGEVLVESRVVAHPSYDDATVRTPTVIGLTAADSEVYETECFGPVAYLIATSGTDESIRLFQDTVRRHGAMTASVYSTSDEVLDDVREAALDAGVALSENLLGGVFVNQSAAFSDFHGTGANPAANASFTDGAFVASRFRIVQSRRHV